MPVTDRPFDDMLKVNGAYRERKLVPISVASLLYRLDGHSCIELPALKIRKIVISRLIDPVVVNEVRRIAADIAKLPELLL